jgi:hypothetical protein
MIFETLWESSKKGELLLIDGGFCHFHLRKDGQLTIREIISQKRGCGTMMLNVLKDVGANSIFAKCPSDLESNGWYAKMGFELTGTEFSKNGREINHWRLLKESKTE